MKDTYSLYEAKAKLSALVRQVRKGRTIVITVYGEAAVELRPVAPPGTGIDARVADLAHRGIIAAASGPDTPIRVGARRPGALKRFLASRD